METSGGTPPRRAQGPSGGLERVSQWLAGLASALALVGLFGLLSGLELLTRFVAGRPVISLVGALDMLLVGAAAWLLASRKERCARKRVGQLLAAIGGLIAGAVLIEYAAGLELGIDRVFAIEPVRSGEVGIPGRPSLPSAISIFLLSLAALLLDVRPRWRIRPSEVLVSFAGLISYTALAAHAYGAAHLYRASMDSLTTMSIPAALGTVLIAGSLLLARSDRGAVSVFASPLEGGLIARRLACGAVTLPILLGVLVEISKTFLEPVSALAMVAVTSSLVGVLLLFLVARRLNASERQRSLAETTARETAERFRGLLEAVPDAVVAVRPGGELVFQNAEAERVFCDGESGVLARTLSQLPPTAGSESLSQLVHPCADGSEIAVEVSTGSVTLGGKPVHIHVIRDIRARQRAEETARRLASIVQNTDDAVVAVGLDERVQSWNPAAERMFGIPASDAEGKHVAELEVAPPGGDEEQTPRALVARVLRGEAIVGREAMRRRSNGEIFPASITVSPLRDANGNVTGISTIVRDITRQKHIEAALRESEARYRAVVENATDGIFVAALDGHHTEVNAQGAYMLGYTPEELLGKTIADLIRAEEIPRLLADRDAVLRGETVVGDWHMRCKDGTWIEVEVSTKLLPDGRWLGLTRDVTQRKELVRALTDAHEAEQQLRAQLEQWTSVIAHDLRQPIGVIELSAAQLARTHAPLPREMRAVERIVDANHRLNRMIEDLLDVSRLEASRLKLLQDRVELGPFVEEVLERMQGLLEGRARLVRRGQVPPVLADPARLEQILGNLLSNAVKYGAPDSEVVVALERSGDHAVVSVTNEGPGVPEDEQAHLFERFHRTAAAVRGKKEGLGLGLYITKGLVKAHGGHIWVESVPGARTTFTFTLPVAQGPREAADPRAARSS